MFSPSHKNKYTHTNILINTHMYTCTYMFTRECTYMCIYIDRVVDLPECGFVVDTTGNLLP